MLSNGGLNRGIWVGRDEKLVYVRVNANSQERGLQNVVEEKNRRFLRGSLKN